MLRLYENFNNLTYKGLFMTEEKKIESITLVSENQLQLLQTAKNDKKRSFTFLNK